MCFGPHMHGPPHNFLMMMSGVCCSNVMWWTMVDGGNAQSIRIHIKVTIRTWFIRMCVLQYFGGEELRVWGTTSI